MLPIILASVIASAAVPTMDAADARAHRELRAAPLAVRDFISRRAGCNHWGGEEPYDADRAAQIAAAVRELRCHDIEADERRIKRKYVKSRRLQWLMAATRDWDGL